MASYESSLWELSRLKLKKENHHSIMLKPFKLFWEMSTYEKARIFFDGNMIHARWRIRIFHSFDRLMAVFHSNIRSKYLNRNEFLSLQQKQWIIKEANHYKKCFYIMQSICKILLRITYCRERISRITNNIDMYENDLDQEVVDEHHASHLIRLEKKNYIRWNNILMDHISTLELLKGAFVQITIRASRLPDMFKIYATDRLTHGVAMELKLFFNYFRTKIETQGSAGNIRLEFQHLADRSSLA